MSGELEAAAHGLSGRLLIQAAISAAAWVERNAAALDAINVFPVPDGDTGTNLSLTLRAAASGVAEESGSSDAPSLTEVAAALARAALLGARGNSGVILSQWLRGLAEAVEGADTVDGSALGRALGAAAVSAAGAISNPREGTMVTVAEAVGEAVATVEAGAKPQAVIEKALAAARVAVAKTPEQMPLLADAGVVDAGGEGLALVLQGMLQGITGEPLPTAPIDAGRIDEAWLSRAEATTSEGRYGFCTEFNVIGNGLEGERLKEALSEVGDSVVVAGSAELLHAHVHTLEPEAAFAVGETYGQVSDRKADDMHEQHTQVRSGTGSAAAVAVVAVAAGDGFAALFQELGATVVDGGHTFNPDAASLLEAARTTGARDVIVLPGHRNVIPAAEQAAALSERARMHVVPTTSMPASVAALLAWGEGASPEETVAEMTNAHQQIVTGAVAHAARTVQAPVPLREGQPFALIEGKPIAGGDSTEHALMMCVEELRARQPQSSLLTLYVGDEPSAETAAAVRAGAGAGLDVEVVVGGQPHYPFIVSLE